MTVGIVQMDGGEPSKAATGSACSMISLPCIPSHSILLHLLLMGIEKINLLMFGGNLVLCSIMSRSQVVSQAGGGLILMASISSLLQEDRKLKISGCILNSLFCVTLAPVFLWCPNLSWLNSNGLGFLRNEDGEVGRSSKRALTAVQW